MSAFALALVAANGAPSRADLLVPAKTPTVPIVDPQAAFTTDLDGDGRVDLLLATGGRWTAWLQAQPNGTFGLARVIAPDLASRHAERLPSAALAPGDVDDGGSAARILTLFPGQPDGGFGPGVASVSLRFERASADEPLEVAMTRPGGRRIHLGDRAIGLAPAQYRLGGNALATTPGRVVRHADLNRDRYADLLVASPAPAGELPDPASIAAAPAEGASSPAGIALRPGGRHPLDPSLPVELSLPAAGPASIEVIDVRGRVILHRDLSALGTGAHRLRLGDGASLRSGIYLVRLKQGRAVVSTKMAVVAP
jgi:hypothetical protein